MASTTVPPRLLTTSSELTAALSPLTCDGTIPPKAAPALEGWLDTLLDSPPPLRVLLPAELTDDEALLSLGLLLTQRAVAEIVLTSVRDCTLTRLALRALELIDLGVDIIACPTCGRCRHPIEPIVHAVRAATAHIVRPLTVAVMGCEVNGPGEAKHADCGIAASATGGILFRRGTVIRHVTADEMADALIAEIYSLVGDDGGHR